MTRLTSVKTNFTAGELAPELLGRGDLRAFENGAALLRNVLILPTGGVTRRPGTAHVATLPGPGRLAAFAFDTEETYLLAFTDRRLTVFRNGVPLAELTAPWSLAQLANLAWTQSADVLLVCHPDLPPRRVERQSDGTWRIAPWRFATSPGAGGLEKTHIPFFRFAAPEVTLSPDGVAGRVRVTASAPVFRPEQERQPFRIHRRQLRFAAIRSPTLAEADVLEPLPRTGPTVDWDEAAFSPVRGWPICAGFHQDRLVIGGSRDLPNRLWFSRSGALFDFDLGTGLDDEAIEFAILSDQVNGIRRVFSGRHLQVFTTGAEWAVTGEPLTPAAIRLDRQTRVGSPPDRQIPVRDVDGATLFAGRGGGIREFLWTDLEATYQANDMALVSGHLVRQPVDLDYDTGRRLLLVVLADGGVAALTLYRTEQVTAWTRLETDGKVLSLAVVGGKVHWLVDRLGRCMVEVWDPTLHLDAALAGTVAAPTARWSGLDHLKGRRVAVVADGAVLDDRIAHAGRLALPEPAREVAAGLRFAHRVAPLPHNPLAAEGRARRSRPTGVGFRTHATVGLAADLGAGPVEVPLRRLDGASVADGPAGPETADRRLSVLGWPRDPLAPLWRVEDDAPLPFTLLSATVELKVND